MTDLSRIGLTGSVSGGNSAPSIVARVSAGTVYASGASNVTYTNQGAAGGTTLRLPTAAAGIRIECVIQAAQTLTVTAATGDTIRIGASVTAAGGSATCSTVGSSVSLRAINETEWVAVASVGSWTI